MPPVLSTIPDPCSILDMYLLLTDSMIMDLKNINARQKVINPLGEVLRETRGSYWVNAGVSMMTGL